MSKKAEKPITKSVTLKQWIWDILEIMADEEMRSVDNLIEWLVEQERKRKYEDPPIIPDFPDKNQSS